MSWSLKCGKQYDWFSELEAQGAKIPELDEKPDLYPDLQYDYAAFFDLSGSRRIGMTSGPIPISEIKAYCEMFGIDGFSERRLFLKRIQILDQAYMEWLEKRLEAKKTSGR